MDRPRIEELRNLLGDSIGFIKIFRRLGSAETVPLAEYRANLKKLRASYDPLLRSAVSTCSLNIGQSKLWEQLLAFVRNELAEYIREGRLESAAVVLTEGRPSSAPVEVVVKNLLRRAIVDGEEAAAQAFFDAIVGTSCSIAEYCALEGVEVDEEIEVFDGIWLVPLPDSPDERPPDLPDDSFSVFAPRRPGELDTPRPRPRTLLRIDQTISPIFHKPPDTHTLGSGRDSRFIVAMQSEGARDFDLTWFFNTMNLSCQNSVRVVAKWRAFVEPFEIFNLTSLIGPISVTWSLIGGPTGPSLLARSGVEGLKKLYLDTLLLDANSKAKLQVPITRWTKSLGLGDPTDQIIDLGIAFEALYLGNRSDELSFRFALRASWYLGKDAADRQRLFPIFRDIYRHRSAAVHAGNFMERASYGEKRKFIEQAQSLCHKSMMTVIEAGGLPDWDVLVLGGL